MSCHHHGIALNVLVERNFNGVTAVLYNLDSESLVGADMMKDLSIFLIISAGAPVI